MIETLKKYLRGNRYIRYIYFHGISAYRRFFGPTSKDLDYKIGLIFNKLNQNNDILLDFLSKKKVIDSARAEKKKRIAFVTILPKDNSGIAVIGLYSFLDSQYPVDVFCPSTDLESYLYNSHVMEGNVNIRLFDAKDLVLATKIYGYEKIIIAIGNSSHHFYVIPLLNRLKEENLENRVVLYIHDVYLWNILFDGQRFDCKSFRREVEKVYSSENLVLSKVNDKLSLQNDLIHKFSLCGARVFVDKFGVRNILTNSNIAANIIEKDLKGRTSEVKFKKIFLPLITQYVYNENLVGSELIESKLDDCCYVGSFGVLSDAKRIDDLLKVFQKFNEKEVKAKLVLAGWGAKKYVESHKNLFPPNVIVIDSPNDSELVFLMKYVDYAVQLRKYNMGESSGVVPMLLELGKTVLVSDIGSFKEFGEEVLFSSGDDLVSLESDILKMISLEKYPSEAAIKEFVQNHSVRKFSSVLYELYSE